MIVVYGKNSGVATTAAYFGNQWWMTAKDERLEPLYSGEPYDRSDYRFLCEKGSLIGAEEPPQGSECAGREVPGCASGYESGAECEDEGGWLLREL